MYIIRLVIVLLISVFVAGCASHNISKQEKGSSAVVLSDDDNNSVDSNIFEKEDIIENTNKTSKEKANIKINGPGSVSKSDFKKSVLLKQKLRKCDVKYEPWADRHSNDLILMPKIIKVCNEQKINVKGYVLHSTKIKRKRGHMVKDHLFLPFNWKEKQISDALNHLPKKVVDKTIAK